MSIDALAQPGRVALAEAKAADGTVPTSAATLVIDPRAMPLTVPVHPQTVRVISRAEALSQLPADMTEEAMPQVAFLYFGLLLQSALPTLERCTNRSLPMDTRIAERVVFDAHLRALVAESARAGAVLESSPVFRSLPNYEVLRMHWRLLSGMVASLNENIMQVSPDDLASTLVSTLYALRDSEPADGTRRALWHAVLKRMVNPADERSAQWWREHADALQQHRTLRALAGADAAMVLTSQNMLGQRFRETCDRMKNPLCLPNAMRYVWQENAPDSNLLHVRSTLNAAAESLSRGVLLAGAELDALMKYFNGLDAMRK